MIFSITLLSFLLLPVSAVVHEVLESLPYPWGESSKLIGDDIYISLSVLLPCSNLDRLEPILKAVSEPSSSQYGQYIDMAEMDDIFGASVNSTNAVVSWLDQSGAIKIRSNKHEVSFTVTVGQANKMLDTSFRLYTDGTTEKLRTMSYSIPDSLRQHVDFISPTTYFGSTEAKVAIPSLDHSKLYATELHKRALPADCSRVWLAPDSNNTLQNYTLIGPECIKALYNIGDYQVDVTSGSTMAFATFLNSSLLYSDIPIFEETYSLPRHNITTILINGAIDNQDNETVDLWEPTLDVDILIGLSGGLPVGQYITGGLPPFIPDLLQPNASLEDNEPWIAYYTYLLSQPNSDLPYVISHSYSDRENTVPIPFAKRVCNMIGMMGLRGRTIVYAGSDSGVGSVCLNNQPPGLLQFEPYFPDTCPYAVSVGGTQGLAPEIGYNKSGGGFSRYFQTAWYQKDAVNTYLDYVTPETKGYYTSNNYTNFSGRAWPDIAAHAEYPWFNIIAYGIPQWEYGVSASVQIVAGIFGLINDARLRAGQPAIGFANPWLYSAADQILIDITAGQAVGCDGINYQSGKAVPGAGIIPYATWNATVGWDPITGLGIPDFMRMKDWSYEGRGNGGNWGGWGDWGNWSEWGNWGSS